VCWTFWVRDMSETPETNKAAFPILSPLQSGTMDVVAAEVARKLERERDELREALRRLYRGYVVTLENGRDRIITLGGDCDPVDRMEREDPLLHDMRALLSRIDGGGT
jgi:hypothetical protein